MSNERLSRLIGLQEESRKERETLHETRAALVQVSEDEGHGDLEGAELEEFDSLTAKIADVDKKIAERDARIGELADEEKREGQSAAALRRSTLVGTQVRVGHEERTYEKGNGRSYLQDLARASILRDSDAQSRLERHGMEVQTEPEYRDINRTDGTGGYFVPPVWLMNDYVALARAGRPTANVVSNMALPPGTDSINVPKVSTGTATAIQTGDNQSVQETDLADTSVSAGVKTIAGQQDIAIQLLDQSPLNFDQIIFGDLMADYATKVDLQVLAGANSSNEVKGIQNATGVNAITYTDASPTLPELYSKIADGIQQIHTGRYLPPSVIIMHPRRWGWMLAALDTTNRPLIVPNANGQMNAAATFNGVVSEQVVGTIQGVPVITDPSVTILSGASTTEDKLFIMRASDCMLWESGIKTRVLPDVGSGTLTVRLQVYGYLAFTAERYPKAISIVSGTGLVTPTF